MKLEYTTQGTCSRKITIDDNNGIVENVSFLGGCHGNTQGISALTKGMKVTDVIARCKGIQCGKKGTSCPDQLALALESTL